MILVIFHGLTKVKECEGILDAKCLHQIYGTWKREGAYRYDKLGVFKIILIILKKNFVYTIG